ncbi:MAG: radical SAM protein, partial [Candidatus Thorarchaeota archaeon]
SAFAWKGGVSVTSDELLAQVNEGETVVLTGGEPLLQPIGRLMKRLRTEKKCKVIVETNGTIAPSKFYLKNADVWSVSPKLSNAGYPNWREMVKFPLERASYLKFVVENKEDIEEVLEFLEYFKIPEWFPVILQPNGLKGRKVAISLWNLISHEKRYWRFRYIPQVHVLLFGQKRGV